MTKTLIQSSFVGLPLGVVSFYLNRWILSRGFSDLDDFFAPTAALLISLYAFSLPFRSPD